MQNSMECSGTPFSHTTKAARLKEEDELKFPTSLKWYCHDVITDSSFFCLNSPKRSSRQIRKLPSVHNGVLLSQIGFISVRRPQIHLVLKCPLQEKKYVKEQKE